VTTNVPAAQVAFARGALLLHLFEYPDAAHAFRAAEQLDPSFAMAYWGEAMTHTHPVWNEQDVPAGRAALAKLAPTAVARGAKAPTARERAFLAAVELLYGTGSKAHRDTLYSSAMGRLVRAYPADDEARLFYALSLLGLSQGVRNVATYLQAATIAESVFHRSPSHPGAAHYLIHAVDDPEHAELGLAAARALARSASAVDHAQHMTSHIFVALGMWDEAVAANETATHVVDTLLGRRQRSPMYCRHYNVWLDYGYLEQGRIGDAARLLERCRDQARARAPGSDNQQLDIASFVTMWSHYVLVTEAWSDSVARWPIDPGAGLGPRLTYWFTHGLAAASAGDLAAARAALEKVEEAARETAGWLASSGEPDPDHPELERTRVLEAELEGVIAAGDGRTEEALSRLRQASVAEDSMVYAFGPPFVNEPAHELLGTELVALKRFREAEAEFARALTRAPRRTTALLGLARAAAALGDTTQGLGAYQELTTIWRRADPGQAQVAEATDYVLRHGGGVAAHGHR
jgi:tetratricopeptide (TPR) repeat protein